MRVSVRERVCACVCAKKREMEREREGRGTGESKMQEGRSEQREALIADCLGVCGRGHSVTSWRDVYQ